MVLRRSTAAGPGARKLASTAAAVLALACLAPAETLRAQAGPAEGPAGVPYNPVDATRFDVSETHERTTTFHGQQERQVADARTRLGCMTIRRTAEAAGFANLYRVRSVTLARNGRPVPSPALAAMKGLELTYVLDQEGDLLEVRGYEAVRERMKASFPDSLGTTLSRLLSVGSLQQADEEAYRETYGDVPEALPDADESGWQVAPMQVHEAPSGETLNLFVAAQHARSETPVGEMVRLTRRFGSDASELAARTPGLEVADFTAQSQPQPTQPAPAPNPSLPRTTTDSAAGESTVEFAVDSGIVTQRESEISYEQSVRAVAAEPRRVTLRDRHTLVMSPATAACPAPAAL